MVITIQIDSRKVEDMFKGYQRTLPKASEEGMRDLARFAVDSYRLSAKSAGIQPWGGGKESSMFGQYGLFYRKYQQGFRVYIVKHGIYLDRMKPHWVALKRGRDITKWAQDKGLAMVMGKGFRPLTFMYPFISKSIYVRPHPFIQNGTMRILRNAKRIVERQVNKAVRRKGR